MANKHMVPSCVKLPEPFMPGCLCKSFKILEAEGAAAITASNNLIWVKKIAVDINTL